MSRHPDPQRNAPYAGRDRPPCAHADHAHALAGRALTGHAPSPCAHAPRAGSPWTNRLVLSGILAGALASACGPADGDPRNADPHEATPGDVPHPPTVLLVTIDTLRADRIGAYGDARAVTPHLDALAAGGRTFLGARSVAPITLPAHTSLLTGTYPAAHGVRDNTLFTVDPRARLLAEVLSDAGFHTGAFVGAYVLDARFGLDQGFQRYTAPSSARVGASGQFVERPAAAVVDDALAWLGDVPADAPVFAWAHVFDPHHPYAPPPPFDAMDDPYAGEIAYADEQLGRLLAGVRRLRPAGPQLVVVTSDHGESLGEHGEATHGLFVYDATLRVPLVLSGTGIDPARVPEPVSLVDVAPTVLAWLARHAPSLALDGLPDAAGTSILGPPDGVRPVLLESLLPFHTRRWHPLAAVVVGHEKYVWTARPELYDLRADPHERADRLADAHTDAHTDPHTDPLAADASPDAPAARERADELARHLASLVRRNAPLGWAARPDDGQGLGHDELAHLAALGYLTALPADEPVLTPDLAPHPLPDGKDRVPDLAAWHEARRLLEQGRRLLGRDGPEHVPAHLDAAAAEHAGRAALEEAGAILASLAERTPDDPSLPGYRGLVELSLGRPDRALPHFEHAARFDVDPTVTQLNLADVYAALGRHDAARAAWRAVLAREPRLPRAFDALTAHHESLGEYGAAAWWRDEEVRRGIDDAARKVVVLTDGGRLRRLARDAGQPVAAP